MSSIMVMVVKFKSVQYVELLPVCFFQGWLYIAGLVLVHSAVYLLGISVKAVFFVTWRLIVRYRCEGTAISISVKYKYTSAN